MDVGGPNVGEVRGSFFILAVALTPLGPANWSKPPLERDW